MTDYNVTGVDNEPTTFLNVNNALTYIETNHDYGTDGMANVNITTSTGETGQQIIYTGASAGTPDASNHLFVNVAAANRHDGTWSASKHYLQRIGSSNYHLMELSESWIHFKHCQFEYSHGWTSGEIARLHDPYENVLFEKCLFCIHSTIASQQDAIYVEAGSGTSSVYVFDCVFWIPDGHRGGVHLQNNSGTCSQYAYIENCTVLGEGTNLFGFGGGKDSSQTSEMEIYNSISLNNSVDYDDNGGGSYSITITGEGNLASDTSAHTYFGADAWNHNSCTFGDAGTEDISFVDATWVAGAVPTGDLTLVEGSGANKALENSQTGSVFQVGSDTSAARVDTTEDVAGNARPATWTNRDCGAFQISVESGTAIPVFANSYRQRHNLSIG